MAFAPGDAHRKQHYYGVFTFAKAWHRQLTLQRLGCTMHLRLRRMPGIEPARYPNCLQWRMRPSMPASGLRAKTRRRPPERFPAFRARHYSAQRDFPCNKGAVALPGATFRQCLQAVLAENDGSLAEGNAGLTSWVNELVWREFYRHVVVGFPHVCRHQPFQAWTRDLPWRDDEAGFTAW
ncbi:hypothetical protein DSL92_01065 [Billgrantia gudaonensis]|uniref:Cryptochrome/DNA photolyase FAD-binding domain-containing protein n=1 Tax=Billgrantia gudaonensis TaxID=376427 RepID=A0A432JKN8_9GAMM|nr:hypothetical protein DSL92_01065 [Halomonas gudaonensis]